jgi:hypothetical protein
VKIRERAADSFYLRVEQALVLQPGDPTIRPGRTRQAALANSESVATLRIDLQLGCHVGALQGQVQDDAVLDAGHRIVARSECTISIRGDPLVQGTDKTEHAAEEFPPIAPEIPLHPKFQTRSSHGLASMTL